jgi:hypothetical protein
MALLTLAGRAEHSHSQYRKDVNPVYRSVTPHNSQCFSTLEFAFVQLNVVGVLIQYAYYKTSSVYQPCDKENES